MTEDQVQLFYRGELSRRLSVHPSTFTGWKHSAEDGGQYLTYEEIQVHVRTYDLKTERILLGAKETMSKDEFNLLKTWFRKERRRYNL